MYTTTPALAVIALRADSGTLRWRFDPFAGLTRELHANRGVAYWEDGGDERILFTAGSWLWAIDARTGAPIRSFGRGGRVDLRTGLGPNGARVTTNVENVDLRPDPSEFELPAGAQRVEAL